MRRTRRSLAPWILGLFQVQGFASVGLLGLRSARNRACRCLVVLFAGACRAVGVQAAAVGFGFNLFSGLSMVLITLFSTVLHRFAFSGLPTFVRKTGGLGWEL